MAKETKIYHVELKREADPYRHQYYGSKASIFEWLTPEDLGITYKTLRTKGDLSKKPYENSKCIIRRGTFQRKQSNRGKGPRS